MSDVTRILEKIDAGDPSAAEKLLPLVYQQLRRLAQAKIAQEKPGQTLQATGGVAPYAWSLALGSLPPGLTLNASTGVISGKPTTLGAWSFTARAQDSQSPAAADTQALSIRVRR